VGPESGITALKSSAARAVELALADLKGGRMVLVVDDEDRENEGDLIMAAQFATPESMAFMIRHTSGVLCVGITDQRADELDLPLMVKDGSDPRGTAFTISVDKRLGTSTGISGADRAATVAALADPATRPTDLSRPGHVFPLRARPGGVLQRAGHTEVAVDLCRLAGLEPAGVLAELANEDGTMARRDDIQAFAARHKLVVISVADVIRYRREFESLVQRVSVGRLPIDDTDWSAVAYRSLSDGVEHLALMLGDVDQRGSTPGSESWTPVLVRVHSECLTGDVFGSRRCDCGEQLSAAIERISKAGRGVIVYLRGHEGRGVGLGHKLRAYSLQDAGLDTVDANLAQGLPIDSREYGVGAQILHDLGVRDIRLMTNNPAKYGGLSGHNVRIVGREPIVVTPNPNNLSYLTTKRTRLNHHLRESEIS
jgi:3,4-dihydroxy 2-butanone 4-phosphate synthase/GTP cyclohydrolase II